MAENHQLDVFGIRATTAANEQTEQNPNSEIEEGEEHATDPRSPARRRRDLSNGTLQVKNPDARLLGMDATRRGSS